MKTKIKRIDGNIFHFDEDINKEMLGKSMNCGFGLTNIETSDSPFVGQSFDSQ